MLFIGPSPYTNDPLHHWWKDNVWAFLVKWSIILVDDVLGLGSSLVGFFACWTPLTSSLGFLVGLCFPSYLGILANAFWKLVVPWHSRCPPLQRIVFTETIIQSENS